MLFSTYGPVLDVVALKTMKMRGQAHVVFRDVQTSAQAMRSLQGFEFFGKEMVRPRSSDPISRGDLTHFRWPQKIEYAKTKSDYVAKLDGTYKMPSTAAGAVLATELQQSIFNAPPSLAVGPTGPGASAATLKPPSDEAAAKDQEDEAKSPQGVKRRRDDESDEEEAPMEEDEDEPMEGSSDDE